MLSRLIELAATHRAFVFLAVVGLCLAGWWSLEHTPIDALPDLSDTQVIVFSRWDRSPDLIENQITYPLITALMGMPKVKTVRGVSDFGYSYIYVIFDEGTDLYWARSRTSEYLQTALPTLPAGSRTVLGPDATALGWIYQYALVDRSAQHSLADLRSLQDWQLRYGLRSVRGVADVASLGGFERQYQVQVDPAKLKQYGLTMSRVAEAVRATNEDVGGRLIEFGGTEYMVRGLGYARDPDDLAQAAIGATTDGSPIRVGDVARVQVGPALRRGVADWNGQGEVVSGIVVMRQDEDPVAVVEHVKQKLEQIKKSLPPDVEIVPIYDRTQLIRESIDTLKITLLEVMLTVAAVILIFLWHPPSAVVPLVTIPAAVLISFLPFHGSGMTANIMSLGGIAIAIGAMVDAAIVVVEQSHKRLERWESSGRREPVRDVIIQAVKEVGPPSFYALLVISVSFLPVMALEGQEGRLFRPLAATKNLAVLVAALLAITLDPALRITLAEARSRAWWPGWLRSGFDQLFRAPIRPESEHPVSRLLVRAYEPVAVWCLERKRWVIGGAVAAVLITIPVFTRLGSEFMPPLYEGTLLYMPSTLPGISITEARRILRETDRVLAGFPEVDQVLGKAGRAETATDPAPLSMLETVITLKPESHWRRVPTWYSNWSPEWLKPAFRWITPDHVSQEALVAEMNAALRVPGLANSWTMPIKGRVEMLSTGIRSALGLKIQGATPDQVQTVGAQVEQALRRLPETRSVFAERAADGYYLDIQWKRTELARYGLSIEDAQQAVQIAIGGEPQTTTVEGRARYGVSVRYLHGYRSTPEQIRQLPVSLPNGIAQIPLGELAEVKVTEGPAMLRDEDGLLTGYVFIDPRGSDLSGYVDSAQTAIDQIRLPEGVQVNWSGQFESMERARRRLLTVVPLTLAVIVLLLYLNTRSWVKTAIVLLAVPFSAVGAVWLLWALGYHLSVGVWVGFIALLGLDAETGVFMLLYLDLAYAEARRAGRLNALTELRAAILEGAVKRIRPKVMTVATAMIGLIPILWSTGTGSDVMKRIAAPMVGGLVTSFLLELLVYPAIYELWRWDFNRGRLADAGDDRRTGTRAPAEPLMN